MENIAGILIGMAYVIGGIMLIILALSFLVFIPLPLYITGKIFGLDSERFTYFSCTWTRVAIGMISFACSIPFVMILGIISVKYGTIDEKMLGTLINVICLAFGIFWFLRFFTRHYNLGYGKAVGILVVTFVFDVIQAIIASILITIIAMSIGFSIMKNFSTMMNSSQINEINNPAFQGHINSKFKDALNEVNPEGSSLISPGTETPTVTETQPAEKIPR
jgi:hypothetical protein